MLYQIQGKDPSVDVTQDMEEDEELRSDDDWIDGLNTSELMGRASVETLPSCELSSLVQILEHFDAALRSPFRRERLTTQIENEGYENRRNTLKFVSIFSNFYFKSRFVALAQSSVIVILWN